MNGMRNGMRRQILNNFLSQFISPLSLTVMHAYYVNEQVTRLDDHCGERMN
ncbi:MAG: hypothetical protein Q9214_003610 [Letrouitia sp. 1 TL-2023]